MIALLIIAVLLVIVARAARNAEPVAPKRGDVGGSNEHRGFDGH